MTKPVSSWPLGASVFQRLKLGFKALQILQYEPDHPEQGALFEWCLDSGLHRTVVKKLKATDEGTRILEHRPTLQGTDLDLASLAALPAGTFGNEFARYFERNKIHPFLTTFAVTSDEVYLAKRYRETHDLLHVITGYETHMLGEMELQAFVLGNLRFPSAAMILVFAMGIRLKACGLRQMGAYLRRLAGAYRRGARSRMMLGIEFERHWATPVAELTAQWCAPEEALPEVTVGVQQPHKTVAA